MNEIEYTELGLTQVNSHVSHLVRLVGEALATRVTLVRTLTW